MGDSDAQTGITRRVVFGAGQMVRAVQSPLEATGPLQRDRPDGTEDKMRTADSRENLVDETRPKKQLRAGIFPTGLP